MSPYETYMQKIAREQEHSSVLGDVASNFATGLMTNTRGGPISLIGSSMGGALDGLLVRPLVHGALGLAEQGIESFAGTRGEG